MRPRSATARCRRHTCCWAARALGLDAGPLSGFDADGVNGEFFADGTWKVNFVINLGYGDPSKVWDRLPRLAFSEGCEVL